MPDGTGGAGRWSRAIRRLGPVALTGSAVVGFWVYPLFVPRGAYGGGRYRWLDVELGFAAAVAWLACLAVAVVPERVRRPLALRLAVALGSLWVAAVACDAAATVWSVRFGSFWHCGESFSLRDNEPDPELIWKHRPNRSWHGRKSPNCQYIHFRTDENGFRNPPGVRQADLVFLGDSVTEAGEVAEDVTFVRKTAQATGLSAVNLGVFSYGPQQELAVLKRYGAAYHPRAVVWQATEWNDVGNAESFLDRDSPKARALPDWRKLYETHSPVVKLIGRLLPARHRNLVEFERTDGAIDRRAIWPYHNAAAASPIGLAETLRVIGAARALCRQRGIAFAVVLAPSHPRVLAPYVKPKTPAERDRYRPAGGLDRPDDLSHALADFCKRIDCPLIDLTGPLRRRAATDNTHIYIKNDAHLDVDGHDEAARQVARWLRSADGLALGETPGAVPGRITRVPLVVPDQCSGTARKHWSGTTSGTQMR